jgi:hypothetical protein
VRGFVAGGKETNTRTNTMKTKMTTRITRLTVAPENEPTYSERATHVMIKDEAAGEFVVIEQHLDGGGESKIAIDPEEWAAIRDAVSRLMGEIERNKPKKP